MQFDREFDIPLDRADARILVRTGGRPVKEYAVLLQLEVGGQWTTIRLVDNHLDEHHMHRYDGRGKRRPGERFAVGKINEVLPKAIEHLARPRTRSSTPGRPSYEPIGRRFHHSTA